MGAGAWLRLLLTLAALWGIAARERLLGTLGEATRLRIPRELRERTRQSGEASWKKTTGEPLKKKFLLRISGGNHTEYEPGRMRFHRGDFSLEILNTSREDGRLYEYSVSRGEEEEVWQIQLDVFEPVAVPSIRILRQESSNGSCSLELRCSSARGDAVSYSWAGGDNGTGGLCGANGSELALSFPLRSAAFGCVCTARNPVSSRRAAFPARCGPQLAVPGVPGLRTELLVVLGVIVIIIIVIVAIVTYRATRSAKCDQDPSQATPDPSQATPDPSQATPASATIYAQVQRVQKPAGTVPSATPPSCTTIYAAATGPPPAPNGAPRTPAGSPTPRGRPPLSQEPTTVYASVTLPVA